MKGCAVVQNRCFTKYPEDVLLHYNSNKHFLLECHMKGHLHLRMDELLQPVDILGIKVMFNMGSR